MIKLKKQTLLQIVVVVCTLLVIQVSKAQDNDKDFAAWSTIGVEYELNKKWTFGLEEQLRLKEDVSVVDEYFTEFTSEYQLFKNFKLGLGLRYINKNDNQGNIQGYENHFRFNVDASYKHKIKDFTLGYRLRYQNKNELGVSYDEGDYVNKNIRFKTSVAYNIKNWALDPKFSAEIFNKSQEGENNGFNKYRLTLGTDYKTKNFGKFGLFYRMEKELNTDYPETTNIVGLKYTYTIKNSKK